MFDLSVRRLLWKEFRTQWNLWVALLGGAFLLQVLFLLFGRNFQRDFVQYPFEVAFVLTACYAIASAAILFAGEREEQTDEWLRCLPVSSGHLLAGKLAYTVVSILLFAAVAIALGAAIKSIAPYGSNHVTREWWERSARFLHGSIGLGLWALFWSLLLNRVMAVLLAAVATQLIVAGIVGNFLPGDFEYWMLAIGILVAVADVWLTRNWLSGRSVAPVFEGNRVATDRRSRFWLRRITRAASRTPLAARTAGVLLWRELRGAVPFAIGWGLLGILCVGLLSYRWWGTGLNLAYLWLTPVICGVMTCAGDNWRNTFRFLSDRGIKPTTVWWIKHVVWFGLAAGLVLLFGSYDATMHTGRSDMGRHYQNVWEMLGNSLRLDEYTRSNSLFLGEMQWRRVSLAASLLIGCYAAGHLCSLWFRRVVVSTSLALLAGVLLLAWHMLMAVTDVSFLYSLWPLTGTLVLAAWASANGWLHEVDGWRVRLQQAAWVVVPVVAVMLGAMWYRQAQIPVVAAPAHWQSVRNALARPDTGWTSRWSVALSNAQQNFSPHLAQFQTDYQQWFEEDLGLEPVEPEPAPDAPEGAGGGDFEMDMGDGMMGMGMGMEGGTPYDPFQHPWDDELPRASIEQFLALDEVLQDDSGSPPRISPRFWNSPLMSLQLHMLGPIFAAAAHQQQEQGELDAAWQTLSSGLRLTAYLQTQVLRIGNLHGVWSARQLIQQQVHAWAAAPGQTAERLQQALDHADLQIPNVQDFRNRRYAWLRDGFEQFDPATDSFDLVRQGLPFFAYWPSERERVVRLMTIVEAGARAESEQYSDPRLNWPQVNSQITPPHIERWVQTTPQLPSEYHMDRLFDVRMLVAASSATRLVLMLQKYRVEHGAFPATLHELPGQVPRDPMSDGEFGYTANGFDAPAVLSWELDPARNLVVPAGTPLLWSPGVQRPVTRLEGELFLLQDVRFDNVQLLAVKEAAEARFAGRQPESPQPPRRLLYVYIGVPPW